MKTEQEMNTSQGKHSLTGYHLYIYPLENKNYFRIYTCSRKDGKQVKVDKWYNSWCNLIKSD
jgi:hypothetical protein